jgi:ABC-2 type transport system ATP-binding protein
VTSEEGVGVPRRFAAFYRINPAMALKGVSLLGRHGAGKTTMMQLLTGQQFATSGTIRVFGQSPVENASVLQHISFIKESQRYPEDVKVKHVFRGAP